MATTASVAPVPSERRTPVALAPTNDASAHYAFGPFTLAPDGLRVGGRRVDLPPTSLGMLCRLVRHTPEMLSYSQLAAAGWPSGMAARTSIARAMYCLRRTLDAEFPGARRWLEAVYSRGYRFASVDVRRVAPLRGALGDATAPVPVAAADTLLARAELLAALHPDRTGEVTLLYERCRSFDPSNRAALRGLVECVVWAAIAGQPARPASAAAIRDVFAAVRATPSDAALAACAALANVARGGSAAQALAAAARAHDLAERDPRVRWHVALVVLAAGKRVPGLDLLASAAYGAPAHERLRRHWQRAPVAFSSGLRGVPLLRALDLPAGPAA
jgi:DNA-binding winged helix-turn-helix (wHTH) protein